MSDNGEDEPEGEAPVVQKQVQQADLDVQYNLPVQAEKFSFAVAACGGDRSVDVDLSCSAFSKHGNFMEAAFHSCPSILSGSVRHCGDNPTGSTSPDHDSEIVHVYPALIPEECCLLMFTVTGDLSSSSTLAVSCYAKEKKKSKDTVVMSDEKSHLASKPESGGRIALAVYRSGNGWLAYHPSKGTHDSAEPVTWLSLVPQMKAIAHDLPHLEAHAAFDPAAMGNVPATVPAKSRDLTLSAPAPTSGDAAGGNDETRASVWPGVAAAGGARGSAPARLRIDVGWALWDGEAAEGGDLQYQLVFAAANGDVVECGEEQGVTQGIVAAPEEDEEADGDDADAAAAKADDVHPAPKGQDVDAHGFPIKDSFFIKLAALPATAASVTLQVTNWAGGGLGNVRSLHARVVDATSEDPVVARDLCVFTKTNAQGASANRSVAQLMKLYKEYDGSAFAQLRAGAARPLAEYLADCDNVRATLAAVRDECCGQLAAEDAYTTALEADEPGEDEEEVPKPPLPASTWRVAGLGLLDKAEDAESYAEGEAKRAATYDGPYTEGGRREGACVRAVYANRDCYIGAYADDARHGKGIYIFANKGAYAGDYEAGKRSGHGMLLPPGGGCYTGHFVDDVFENEGAYEYPDGSCYVGSWAAGKKHGPGRYWDKFGGCMAGAWVAGTLAGSITYQQPAFELSASYTKGVPDGPCAFTTAAFRKLQLKCSEAAASHIRAADGPVLTQRGEYRIPAGSAADPQVDEEGNVVEDEEAPALPAPPHYAGLFFQAAADDPAPAHNMVYPPPDASVPATVVVQHFSMGRTAQA